MTHDGKQWAEQAAAFQRIWLDAASRMMESVWTSMPDTVAPELLRQMRGDVFDGLMQSWDRLLRSPEFLRGLKEWTDNGLAMRKSANEFLAKVRNEWQIASSDDVEDILRRLGQLERRILERLERIEARMPEMERGRDRGDRRDAAALSAGPNAPNSAARRRVKAAMPPKAKGPAP
jgi:uncharacterized protein (DUF2267 family)